MILVLDTHDKFMAVWTALNQFVDNQVEREDGDPVPPEEVAAVEMIAKMDAVMAKLAG